MTQPFVSIVTVNYNGKRFLKDFLDSVYKLEYPPTRFEMIIVDNMSSDDSVKFIKKNYPQVILLQLDKNYGFGEANNRGINQGKGDLFFLVNNDTVLMPDTLTQLVTTFQSQSKRNQVGAVNAKLVLMDKYLPLMIDGTSLLDFAIDGTNQPANPKQFVLPLNPSNSTIELFLPFNFQAKQLSLELKLVDSPERKYRIYLNDSLLKTKQSSQVKLKLSNLQLKKNSVDLVQNAGSYFFRDGYGRDRGAFVTQQQQFYEADQGQFDQESELMSFCGGGVLLNKQTLDQVGVFDRDYYFYYEDADLALRMRHHGWKIFLSPFAKIRHLHAGSSQEWSDFFVFNAERGRLLLLAKHWPKVIAIRYLLSYIFLDTLGKPFYFLLKGKKRLALSRLFVRLKVTSSVALPFLRALAQNHRLSTSDMKALL